MSKDYWRIRNKFYDSLEVFITPDGKVVIEAEREYRFELDDEDVEYF